MFTVNCVIYPCKVLVSLGDEPSELIRILKKWLPKNLHGELDGIDFHRGKYVMFSNGASFIWMDRVPVSSADISCLVHEIFHCVCGIMDRIGSKLTDETEEPYAYLLDFLTREILGELDMFAKK
jgi:hypothetical protein